MFFIRNLFPMFWNKGCHFSRSFQPKYVGLIFNRNALFITLWIICTLTEFFIWKVGGVAIKLGSKEIREEFANYCLLVCGIIVWFIF